MSSKSSKLKRRLLIGLAAMAVVVAIAAGSLYALLTLSVTPLVDGVELSDGAVRVVVTDRVGPFRIAAYLPTLEDGERLTVSGTTVELFALPGHTEDSVAVLAHGVLFLGDSAASLHDGTMYPNTILSDDPASSSEARL